MQEAPLIMDSFEKDGILYPPLYKECSNCIRSLGRLSFSFTGIQIDYICPKLKRYVEADDWCLSHILDPLKIDDATEEELERLELAGMLTDDYELTDEEIEAFRAESL